MGILVISAIVAVAVYSKGRDEQGAWLAAIAAIVVLSILQDII